MDLSTYDTCPGCGGRKRKCARSCRSCRYKVGSTRTCTKCKQSKPISEFRIRTRATPKPRSTCRACEAETSRAYVQRRAPEERKKATRLWEKANPQQFYRQKIRRRLRILGIQEADIPAAVVAYEAAEVCEICGVQPDQSLHIDHAHGETRVRGFLCSTCNTGLGQFSDSIKKLEGAIEYLKRHQLRPRQ